MQSENKKVTNIINLYSLEGIQLDSFVVNISLNIDDDYIRKGVVFKTSKVTYIEHTDYIVRVVQSYATSVKGLSTEGYSNLEEIENWEG